MLHLSNNCRMGKISVRPSNWKSSGANVNLLWKISYWFYDDNLKQRKLVVIQGMNRISDLKIKQAHTREAIEAEIKLLQADGFNPITGTRALNFEPEIVPEVYPDASICDALQHAYGKIKTDPGTLACIKSCLKYIIQTIRSLKYQALPVGQTKTRHIETFMDACEKERRLSASSYNHYRTYLFMLFKVLKRMEAISFNPVADIEKRKEVRRMRPQLTKEERKRIREHLVKNDPKFWAYVHLLYHSGGREIELLRVKACDVDLAAQRFKVLIKKGKSPREEIGTIKDVILADWKYLMDNAGPEDYLFGKGLVPGKQPTSRDFVTRRWEQRVKTELGIDKDMYLCKHTNLDETAEYMESHKDAVQTASKAARHATPVVTMNHYLAGEQERQRQTVQKIENQF